MRLKKENYFILSLAGVLLLIIFTLVFFIFRPSSTPNNNVVPTPIYASPTPIDTLQQPPPVDYDTEATDRLIDKVENRPPLSSSDQQAKQNILSLLPNDQASGYIYTSPNVAIEYAASPDTFLAEIYIENITRAKTEAVNWLKNRGLSEKGVCDLPISFFLNWEVANKLRGTNINFSPLPDGC